MQGIFWTKPNTIYDSFSVSSGPSCAFHLEVNCRKDGWEVWEGSIPVQMLRSSIVLFCDKRDYPFPLILILARLPCLLHWDLSWANRIRALPENRLKVSCFRFFKILLHYDLFRTWIYYKYEVEFKKYISNKCHLTNQSQLNIIIHEVVLKVIRSAVTAKLSTDHF